MPVKLSYKKNKKDLTPFLDIHTPLDGAGKSIRNKEYLIDCKILINPRTPAERTENKNRKAMAEHIRNERERQIMADGYNVRQHYQHGHDFLQYFDDYVNSYTKKDIRTMRSCKRKLAQFVKEKLKSSTLNSNTIEKEETVEAFRDYLLANQIGEGPATYFKRFKKVLKAAKKKGILRHDPGRDITIKEDKGIKKATLTPAEMQIMANTPCNNIEVKRAFLFCCYSGLRWGDVKALNWSNIDWINSGLKFTQSKTGDPVSQLLDGTRLDILNQIKVERGCNKSEVVFRLPSQSYALRSLKEWTEAAGIVKHITWHCARHSCGTLWSDSVRDTEVVMDVMGHKDVASTLRYSRLNRERVAKGAALVQQIKIQ